jgi:uncharacterized protein YecA (UPF0149 family)
VERCLACEADRLKYAKPSRAAKRHKRLKKQRPTCHGFKLGVEHHQLAWKRWFEDIRRQKAISLILGMADPEILRQTENAVGEEIAWETVTWVADLVPLIRDYWAFEFALDEYLGAEPATQTPKVGRNDPCPCGSGKKFKHCHGRFENN